MAGQENTNLGFDQQGTSGLFTGSKSGKRVDHPWYHLWGTLENAINPDFVGYGDDFLGDTIRAEWQPTVTNASTIAINTQNGGAIRMTTDTGASDAASEALGIYWLVSNGWTVCRGRIKQVTAITNRLIEFGLNDAVAPAGGLAFSDPSVPTAVSANAAVFAYKDGSMTTYSALAVNASGTPQAALAVATPTTAYQYFSIEIDPLGNAYFFLGNPPVLVATLLLAVATTAILTPWVAIKNGSAAAHSQDVDFLSIHGTRV